MTQIVIRFDAALDPMAVRVTSDMGDLAGLAWSTAVAENDMLTLAPSAAWSSGAGTLTIDGASSDV